MARGCGKGLETAWNPAITRRAGAATFAPEKAEIWSGTDGLLKFLAARLLDANPDQQAELRHDLYPIGQRLLAPLRATFLDAGARDTIREAAAWAILYFAHRQPEVLAELAYKATPEQYAILFPRLTVDEDREAVGAALAAVAREQPGPDWSEAQRVELGHRRADSAVTLIRLGQIEPALEAFHVDDDPEALTEFVHRSRDRGLRPDHLLDCLKVIGDRQERGDADNERARFAILLALGEFELTELPGSRPRCRGRSVGQLIPQRPAIRDPSAPRAGCCVVGGFERRVTEIDQTPLDYDPTGRRQWFVQRFGRQYITFVIFPPCPDGFMMGSPMAEAQRLTAEVLHRVRITRPFAISDREITLEQWLDFIAAYRAKYPKSKPFMGHDIRRLGGAATQVPWDFAVEFCRLLTQVAGLSEADQCYEDDAELESDSTNFPVNWSCQPERPGVRLPTEAEWEYACRAGMKTAFGFGSDPRLLSQYAWFEENSELVQHQPGLLRPNMRGLFDMHGNVSEWCTDFYDDYPEDMVTNPAGAALPGQYKINRGGNQWFRRKSCRAASRDWSAYHSRYNYIGFRIVRTLPASALETRPAARPQLAAHELRTLREHTDTVFTVAFSPDGKLLATGANDNKIVLRRGSDGEGLRILPANVAVACLSFNPDGTILASGNYHGDLQLWRVGDGTLLRSIPAHGDTLMSLAFSPDGKILAAGGNDRSLRLWRTADWQLIRELKLPPPGFTSPTSIKFHPDGTRLAAGYDDGDLRIWSVASDQPLKTLEECKKEINSVAFSPDGASWPPAAMTTGSGSGASRTGSSPRSLWESKVRSRHYHSAQTGSRW